MVQRSDINVITRLLTVIEILNQNHVTSIDTIFRQTGLPKPTIVRILRTLVRNGYVAHVSRTDGYALTEKILRLSSGFCYSDALVDIVRPLFDAFTRAHKWQLTLATPDREAMLVRYNTRHICPFAPDMRYLNHRLTMTNCAMGLAYLAFCSDREREVIAELLRTPADGSPAVRLDGEIGRLIENARTAGYATSGYVRNSMSSSFAVPILSKETGHAIAAIAISYFTTALADAQATARYLEPLSAMADRIATQHGVALRA